jgi:hypothetical protein
MSYQAGSCIICGRGTDTGVAVRGEGEWHIAALINLGVPEDEAEETHRTGTGSDLGKVPAGTYTVFVRVCAACIAEAPAVTLRELRPALLIRGGMVPGIVQPDELDVIANGAP